MLQRILISTVSLLMLFAFSIEVQALTIQLFDYEIASDGQDWQASTIIGADYVWIPDTYIDLVIDTDTSNYFIQAWRDGGTLWDFDDDTDVTSEITFVEPWIGGGKSYIYIKYTELSGSGDLDIVVTPTDDLGAAVKTLKIGTTKIPEILPSGIVNTQITDAKASLIYYGSPTINVDGDIDFAWSDDIVLDIAFQFKQDTTDQPIDLLDPFDGPTGDYWAIAATQGGTDITNLLEFSIPFRWKKTIDAATDIQVYTKVTEAQHWIYVGYDDADVPSNDPITFTITLTDRNSSTTPLTLTVNLQQ